MSLVEQSKTRELSLSTDNTPMISPKHKEQLILIAKIVTVAVVIAGLITAAVFTGGAALALAGAAKLAVFGVAGGIGISALLALRLSDKMNMFKYTGNDVEDTLSFLALQITQTVISAGVFAGLGAAIACDIALGFAYFTFITLPAAYITSEIYRH